MANKTWSDLIKDHKILLITVVIGFFLIEIEIFAVAVMKSGRQSWMNIMKKDSDQIIYQVKGSTLTNFNKYYFENTFGSIDNYNIKITHEDVPFPFRAWFAAAIGVPIGLILLLAFILKAVMVLLYGKKSNMDYDEAQKEISGEDGENDNLDKTNVEHSSTNPQAKEKRHRKENSHKADMQAHIKFGTAEGAASLLDKLSRLNIFIIGFLILSGILLYLIIPNMLTFLAKAGIETLINFKWFFIVLFAGVFFLFAWFMYMKYQLAKKSMDAQTEIRKYEIKMEYAKFNAQTALEYKRNPNQTGSLPMLDYSDVEYKEDKDTSSDDRQDE